MPRRHVVAVQHPFSGLLKESAAEALKREEISLPGHSFCLPLVILMGVARKRDGEKSNFGHLEPSDHFFSRGANNTGSNEGKN